MEHARKCQGGEGLKVCYPPVDMDISLTLHVVCGGDNGMFVDIGGSTTRPYLTDILNMLFSLEILPAFQGAGVDVTLQLLGGRVVYTAHVASEVTHTTGLDGVTRTHASCKIYSMETGTARCRPGMGASSSNAVDPKNLGFVEGDNRVRVTMTRPYSGPPVL
jgi:hypothetical protein